MLTNSHHFACSAKTRRFAGGRPGSGRPLWRLEEIRRHRAAGKRGAAQALTPALQHPTFAFIALTTAAIA